MMRIIVFVLLITNVLLADAMQNRINNQRNYRNIATTSAVASESTGKGTRFFVGIGGGINNAKIKNTKEELGVETVSVEKKMTFGAGLQAGIVNIDRYLGGRFYGEGYYMQIPNFNIFNLGLNLDMLINFIDSQIWNVGVFVGIGGGMYVAMPKGSDVSNSGKVPFSPSGWVNTGFRISIGNHGIDILYRIPYVYASIYNATSTEQTVNGTQSKRNAYHLKTDFISVNYVYSF